MSNKLEEATFQELVDEATRSIHNALLEEGGKGMKRAISMWMSTSAQWRELRLEKQK